MLRSKVVKRKTKNKETLLRNLRKGKARLEDRCGFQIIPYPLKLICPTQLYLLCGDLVLMEHQNTIILENSLINNFKTYKHSQIFDLHNQKLVRVMVENRELLPMDWKRVVDRLRDADTENLREMAEPVKNFGQRYEELVKDFEIDMSLDPNCQEIQSLREINEQAENTRISLIQSCPYFELKSQFKDGRIQLTEMLFNEKFVNELGYSVDNFSTAIFQEGLPKLMPYENQACPKVAKIRLSRFLKMDKNSFTAPEVEANLLMKSGYLKKVRFTSYYYPTFEKGIPGYSVFLVLIARQKPTLNSRSFMEPKLNSNFVELMARKEQEMDDFIGAYYGESIEKTYTNINKVCKVRELAVGII